MQILGFSMRDDVNTIVFLPFSGEIEEIQLFSSKYLTEYIYIYIIVYVISCASCRNRTFYLYWRHLQCVSSWTPTKRPSVPWNYAAKLEELNKIIKQGGGSKKYDFKSYLKDMWDECMADTDAHLKVADKPTKKK